MQYWGGYNPLTSPTCDTVFTEMYNYGVPGSPVGKQLTVSRGGVSFALAATYTYDTEGRMSAETYPTDNSGTTSSLSYTFDSMGRLYSMTDALAMQTIIAGASYGPANEITGITGATGGWAGESRTYNSLKQLTGISAGAVSVTYAYPSTQNNGKISSETDGGYSGEVITYTYDSLNRLITASDQPTWPFSWGQSYGYDGFGNLTSATVTQGTAPAFTQSYDVNNHAGGEDANGNPGNVPLPAYGTSKAATYDVENRLVAIAGTSSNPTAYYSYDPSNKRVWRGNWAYSGSWARTEDEITFWSVTGQKLATYNVTQYGATLYATQSGTNYYFGAKLIKNASGWVYSNRLGSIGTFFPYGQERPSATTNNTEKFTGYFRDAETGNDYAVNRYTSPGYGRFVTPDRMTGDPADPASWNKYAYTEGDPVNAVDPEGMCRLPPGGGTGVPPIGFPGPPDPDPEFIHCGPAPVNGLAGIRRGPGKAGSPRNGFAPGAPPTLWGAPNGVQSLFDAAFNQVIAMLGDPLCSSVFQGPSSADLQDDLKTALYLYAACPGGANACAEWPGLPGRGHEIGTITVGNNGGKFTTGLNQTFANLPGNPTLAPGQFRDFILLHELGHLVQIDADANNYNNPFNIGIINDCIGTNSK